MLSYMVAICPNLCDVWTVDPVVAGSSPVILAKITDHKAFAERNLRYPACGWLERLLGE